MNDLTPFGGDFNSGPITMSSREIAGLCEKRHDHVLRDIEKMLQDIDAPKFGAVDFQAEYTDAKGQTRKEYRLPKDLTVTLITGYRADLRYKVVKRLEELEGQSNPATIDLNDPNQLVPLLTNYAQRTQIAESRVVELEPKAEAFDQIDALEGALSVRPAAKVLSVPEHKLKTWLQMNKWAFRQNGKGPLQAYSDKCNVGYLDHKLGSYENSKGEKVSTITLMITPKGLKRLAQIFAKEGGTA